MAGHLTPELVEFIFEWLLPAPAHVLEVGCGDGSLTRLLGERGYDAVGLDPDAPDGPEFIRGTLEGFERDQEFDAAVAVRSLHHLHDVDRATGNLRDAIQPGGHLILFEFAIENVDAPARRWLEAHGLPHPVTDTDPHEVIPGERLRMALERRFRTLAARPATYLAREADREDLVTDEERAIRAGEIKPAGMRLVLERP